MREKIVFLSILLSLPLRTYGYITIHCPDDSIQCDNTPGCKYTTLSGCTRCDNGEYCPGDGSIKSCTDLPGSFPKSPEGSTDISDCYKPTSNSDNGGCEESNSTLNSQCGLFHPDSTARCWDNNGNYDENYHRESGDKCYSNTRQCKLFGIVNNSCSSADNISGNATWHPLSEDWGVGNCECGAVPFTDNNNRMCQGTQSGVRPSISSVDYATSNINYNGTSTGYHCTSCIPDNGNNKYYASSENGNGCTANLSNGVVCKCETSTHHGHYRKGNCCESNTNCPAWTNANGQVQIDNICTRVACDIPGTTTEDLLPTSNNNSVCVYGPLTEMHDSVGDFKLQEIPGGLDPYGWEKIY